MPSPKFYCAENIAKVRSAQFAVMALSAIICIYFISTTIISYRTIWSIEKDLIRERENAADAMKMASESRKSNLSALPQSTGGIEFFAVQISNWARENNLKIDSLTPEGLPCLTEINAGDLRLGMWNANKVRVQGSGGYSQIMVLFEKLLDPRNPLQIESFSLRSNSNENTDRIGFDLFLTVYEKKGVAG